MKIEEVSVYIIEVLPDENIETLEERGLVWLNTYVIVDFIQIILSVWHFCQISSDTTMTFSVGAWGIGVWFVYGWGWGVIMMQIIWVRPVPNSMIRGVMQIKVEGARPPQSDHYQTQPSLSTPSRPPPCRIYPSGQMKLAEILK